ncbi:MAG: biotin/lipoyl-containing protein [Limnochordales bacterium]|nr:acetyl-CoA carboxylase biotin carboxyl carrier protein subunit [Bacillota bacterium]
MTTLANGSQRRRRRFAVTVDGVRHEVIVEELDVEDPAVGRPGPGDAPRAAAGAGSPPKTAPNTSGAAGADAVAATGPAGANGSGGLAGGWLTAPMPGTVTEVKVRVGETVPEGAVLLILTAMKLENEITAPAAGTVAAVAVSPGDNVNTGQPLVRFETGGDAP